MNILLTGGTGFIGSALCRRLANEHQLTVLTRRPHKVVEICGAGVAAISSLDELSEKQHFDAVINLAGEPIADRRWSKARKQKLRDSRIALTEQLIAYFERAERKPDVLINGSAVGFYGDQGDHILDEESDSVNDFAHQLCRDWEQQAQRASDFGIRVCIVRLGLVVGPEGGFLQRMLLPFKMGLGGRIGSGRQWMSWVHRDDVLALIEYLMVNQVLSGAFNATAPHPVSNEQFTQQLARQLHRPAFLPVPALVLKLMLGEMSELLLGGQRVIPAKTQQSGFEFRFKRLGEALADVLG